MSDLKFTTAADYMKVDYSTRVPFTRHGGAYDRGSADSYYRRARERHYFTSDSFNSTKIEEVDMSAEEIAAYNQGYDDNEKLDNKKEWN
jgi:hypothetical protein